MNDMSYKLWQRNTNTPFPVQLNEEKLDMHIERFRIVNPPPPINGQVN